MNQQEKSLQSVITIIEAGINEFAEKGRLVSLNGICQNHKISKGKLYHHFSSKDELLCACVCYALDNLRTAIDDYEIDSTLNLQQAFHKYYKERIVHWYENPNQLTVLRLAYSLRKKIFSQDSLEEIRKHQDKWRESKRKKVTQIIHSTDDILRIDDKTVADILLIMYENTFQVLEDQMIFYIKNGNDQQIVQASKQLLDYHDTIIDMILYGAFKS